MAVLLRLIKVVYVLLLLFGIVVGLIAWNINSPYAYTTYSYLVTCDNGKTFDPTSKPIDAKYMGDSTPLFFNSKQIRSECKYGIAYYVGLNIPDNYELVNIPHEHSTGSQSQQIQNTLITLVVYYLIIEILRRTFLYIFFGKNFIAVKKIKAKVK